MVRAQPAAGARRDVGRAGGCGAGAPMARHAVRPVCHVGRETEANWLAASSPVLGAMAVLLTFLVPLAAVGVFVAFVRSRGL